MLPDKADIEWEWKYLTQSSHYEEICSKMYLDDVISSLHPWEAEPCGGADVRAFVALRNNSHRV